MHLRGKYKINFTLPTGPFWGVSVFSPCPFHLRNITTFKHLFIYLYYLILVLKSLPSTWISKKMKYFQILFKNTFNSDKVNLQVLHFYCLILREVGRTSQRQNDLGLIFALYLSNFQGKCFFLEP